MNNVKEESEVKKDNFFTKLLNRIKCMDKNKKIILASVTGGVLFIVIVLIVSISVVSSAINNLNNQNGIYSEIGSSKTNKKEEKSNGKLYNFTKLADQNARITAFEGLIPEGWTANIQSNWNVVSSNVPGVETVSITSPDGKASIVIDSNQAFVENPQYAEGVNYDYYSTYLHYMNADEFVQYYMDLTYGADAVLEKDLDDDSDVLKSADECTNLLVENLKASSSWINTGNYGVQYSVSSVPATMSKRQYKIGESYLEGSCVIIAVDTSLASRYVATNNSRDWEVLYSIVFKADDKETFDKYYEDYNFIIANSHFTTDYYALVEYVSSSIVNSYAQYYAAKAQAGLDAMNDYINSNYSSTSSQSTNDKVMEMWDDCINEVDKYQTLDGGSVKTSIHNDTVAQSGDTFYVGSKAGIPSGFTELTKGY